MLRDDAIRAGLLKPTKEDYERMTDLIPPEEKPEKKEPKETKKKKTSKGAED